MRGRERHEAIDRALLCAIALIPTGLGLFAFLNNVSGWRETVRRMVHPMLSMEGTFGNPYQMWRAVDSLAFANAVYFVVFLIEGLFGAVALAGTMRMLRSVVGPAEAFQRGLRTVKTACMLAVFVYGFLFFTVGGDWFLAWQNPDLGGLQRDAVNYGVIVILAYIVLDANSGRHQS